MLTFLVLIAAAILVASVIRRPSALRQRAVGVVAAILRHPSPSQQRALG